MSEKEENVAYYDILLCFTLNWRQILGPKGTFKILPTALLGMLNETDNSDSCLLDRYITLLLEKESDKTINDINYIPVPNISPYCVDEVQKEEDSNTINLVLFPTAHNDTDFSQRIILTPLGGLHTYKVNQPLPVSYFKEGKCFPEISTLEMMIRYDFNYIHGLLILLAEQAYVSYINNPAFSTIVNNTLLNSISSTHKHHIKNLSKDKNSKIINIEDYLKK